MKYYIVDVETDKILDGSNSPIEAELKAKDISRRIGIKTTVIEEGR